MFGKIINTSSLPAISDYFGLPFVKIIVGFIRFVHKEKGSF